MAHPVAVAVDVEDMRAVEQPVQERRGHDLVVQGLAPALETPVRRQYRRGASPSKATTTFFLMAVNIPKLRTTEEQ